LQHIFLLLICLPAYSQPSTAYIARYRAEYRLPYYPGNKGRFQAGNVILTDMAREVLREPWLVKIKIACDLEVRIVREQEHSRLTIIPLKLTVEGDTLFRTFSISGALSPSHLSVKMKCANRGDSSSFNEQTLKDIPLRSHDTDQPSFVVALFDPEVDTLLIRDAEFRYDSLAIRSFKDRINLIHDYFASLALIDSLQILAAGIRIDEKSMIPVNFLKVEEISRALERINVRDFPGKLLQNGHDPGWLTARYREMLRQSRTLLFSFLDELKKTGVIPWDGNTGLLADYFTTRVMSYIRRSFLMDYQQGLIYTDILEHIFEPAAFSPGEDIPAILLRKMFPDALQDTVAGFVSRKIYDAYRSMAMQLIGEQSNTEAFALLGNGRRFIASIPAARGIIPDDMLQSRAAGGIFNSYLGIASSCLESRKFAMAETYLEKARQYAAAHRDFITSDSAYRELFGRLFFLRNGDCDRLLEQERYADALDCYLQIERDFPPQDVALVGRQLEEKKALAMNGMEQISIARSEDALKRKENDTALYYYDLASRMRNEKAEANPAQSRLDSLAPVMAKLRYASLSAEGATALEKRQFTLAVMRFGEADSLSKANGIARSSEFDSLYRRATKHFLIIELRNAKRLIWVSLFDSAQAALNRVTAEAAGYGLEQDPDFVYAADRFRQKMLDQLCSNLRDSVDLLLIRADRGIALLNYTGAMAFLEEALALIRNKPECGIGEPPVADTIVKYRQPAVYQKNLADIRSLVATGNHAKAVLALDESQRDFQAQHLDRFGLPPESAYDFIRDRGNPYLTEKAMEYYLEKGNEPEAYRFLMLAHMQGLPAPSTAALQERLGVMLARIDHMNCPGDDPQNTIIEHIPDDGWFTAFRKSYLGEWKRLAREAGKSVR